MKNRFNEMFGFSKRELNGLTFLVFIIMIVTAVPYAYRYAINRSRFEDPQEKTMLKKLILVDRYERKNFRDFQDDFEKPRISKVVKYHQFDPNEIDETVWQQFGLSPKQAMSIVNYIKKGGKFRKPEDLKRMYTISPEKYESLLPYVVINHTANNEQAFDKPKYEKKAPVIIEINSADTLQLDQIRGVGLSFARRIVKYRERLGGFYEKEQLMEVFGIDSLKFSEIKDQVRIDLDAIKKININTAEFESLKAHPYLKYKEMNAIIQYRKQHGPYKSVADLRKIVIFTPQTIDKIAPYLVF